MKKSLLALSLLLPLTANSALLTYGLSGDLYDVETLSENVGSYDLTISYDTESKSFTNGWFDSNFATGAANWDSTYARYVFVGEDDFYNGWDLSGQGLSIDSGNGAYFYIRYLTLYTQDSEIDPFTRLHQTNDFEYYFGFTDSNGVEHEYFSQAGFGLIGVSAEEVPEPSSLALLSLGVALLGWRRR